MTTRARVLRSMLVWRTVATTSRATLLARAQMKPVISRLNALFANSIFRLLDIGNPIDVNAYLCCHAASIQFAGDNPLGAAEQAWDTPSPDLKADPSLTQVRRNYQQPARLKSHRRKKIGYRCYGTFPEHL